MRLSWAELAFSSYQSLRNCISFFTYFHLHANSLNNFICSSDFGSNNPLLPPYLSLLDNICQYWHQDPEIRHEASLDTIIKIKKEPSRRTMWGPSFGNLKNNRGLQDNPPAPGSYHHPPPPPTPAATKVRCCWWDHFVVHTSANPGWNSGREGHWKVLQSHA